MTEAAGTQSGANSPLEAARFVPGQPDMWAFVIFEAFLFTAYFTVYVICRVQSVDLYLQSQAHLDLRVGVFNTLVLLSSSLSAVLAHHAAEQGDGKKAAKLLWLTILGALTFLGVKAVEWTIEITAGYTITSSGFWGFYYTAAGIHASHVIVGGIAMAFVAMDAAKGKELQRVEYIGIYWHFVDVVWIFLFPLLYIAK